MTTKEASDEIVRLIRECQGSKTVVIALIGEEGQSGAMRVIHPLAGGQVACAAILRATASQMDPEGEEIDLDVEGEDPSDEEVN